MLLLAVVSYNSLFLGTAVGFAASAALVVSVLLPSPKPSQPRGIYDRTTRGIRIYLATPRLRGLLALNMAAAAAGAMVLVNSIVLVRSTLGLDASALAWTLFAFGAGSMIAALLLPKLLDTMPDRPVMFGGAALMVLTLLGLAGQVAVLGFFWPVLLGAWRLMGLGYSTVLTPSGRLRRRSAHAEDPPALFAAQFALSHACWLVTYPLSGWLMTRFGPVAALAVLAILSGAGIVAVLRFWSSEDPEAFEHTHQASRSASPVRGVGGSKAGNSGFGSRFPVFLRFSLAAKVVQGFQLRAPFANVGFLRRKHRLHCADPERQQRSR